ncbi:MAG: hypothetical protein ABJM22_09640 [Balneola sp.]
MTKISKIILFVFLFSGMNSAFAQTSMSDFLLTAFEDINTRGYDKSINFLSPKNYRLPVVEDLEFRFGNDELTLEDQQYAIRFRPGNPWKIRRNNALFNATKKELSIRKQIQYQENLENRYELAADYLLKIQLLNIEQQKFSLIQKRVDIFNTNMESSLFDAKDFVDAKLDQVDAITNQEELSVSLLQVKREISSKLQQSIIDWSTESLISVTAIDSVTEIINTNSLSSLELDLLVQRIKVAKSEVRLEKADFDIGYFQTEYYPEKDRDSDYGIAFGISIPIFKSNKSQVAERKLDEIELNGELATEQYQDSVKRITEYEYLKSLITQHEVLIERIKELDLETLSKNLSQIEDNNPLTILELQEGLVKLKELQLKSYERVVEQYIEFLSTFNVLTQLPLTNYLTESLEPLE